MGCHGGENTRGASRASELSDRCIRLDVSLGASEPRLNDARAIPSLKPKVRCDTALLGEVDEKADRVVASLFYFELGDMPVQNGSVFQVQGHIMCLRKGGDPALLPLIEKVMVANAKFVVNGEILASNLLAPSFWDRSGCFLLPIRFQATGPALSISLTWGDGQSYPISGSPYSVHQLVRYQGLDTYFGLPDHRRAQRAPPSQQVHVRGQEALITDRSP